ncbi:MAG TPA: PAS domain S-box protein [Planctomycetota bacterium]|nr:PAS domain S-box protein [Planctomycetota bacterium]
MTFVLCLSLVLQLIAATLALRLGREAGWARGWLFLAAALLLMAARRAVTLEGVIAGNVRPDAFAELVAIVISILMLLGVTVLGPFLRSAQRAEGVVPQLLESAPDAMIAADESDRITHVNGAAVRLLGYPRAELVGMDVGALAPERFRERHREAFRRYFANPRARLFAAEADFHVLRKDGTEVPVEISIAPLETGSRKLVVGSLRDVSERRRAEAATRESEGRYRSLIDDVLDSSSVGVCIIGPDRKVVWVNRSFAAFFGLDAKRTAGADAPELATRLSGLVEDPSGFRERLIAAYAENTRAEAFECHVLPGEGRWERWLEHRSQPIASGLYDGGRIDQYADITERKLAEQRIRQFVNIARNMQMGLLVYRLDDREDDRSLRLVIVNPAAERYFGIPKDELLGRRIDEIFPALRARGIPALFAEVIRTGETRETSDFDYGDGRVLRNIWAFKAFPLPDESVGVVFESVTDRRRSEELVSNIAAGVADAGGDEFFRSLVLYLAKSLGVEYALVGELRGGDVACVALYDHGEVRTDVRYALDGTPCEEVTTGRLCCHPERVRERFPRDKLLGDMGAECYLGTPLFDAAGRPLGLMAVIGQRPLEDAATAESVLRIFAARAAAELERRRDRGVPTAP